MRLCRKFKNVENIHSLIINNKEEEKELFSFLPLPKTCRGDVN